jgi:hypothetical protein
MVVPMFVSIHTCICMYVHMKVSKRLCCMFARMYVHIYVLRMTVSN